MPLISSVAGGGVRSWGTSSGADAFGGVELTLSVAEILEGDGLEELKFGVPVIA
jgi:hypothetical protein